MRWLIPSKVLHLPPCHFHYRLSLAANKQPLYFNFPDKNGPNQGNSGYLEFKEEGEKEAELKLKGDCVLKRKEHWSIWQMLVWDEHNRIITFFFFFAILQHIPNPEHEKYLRYSLWVSGDDRRALRRASLWTERLCLISLCYNYPALEMMITVIMGLKC